MSSMEHNLSFPSRFQRVKFDRHRHGSVIRVACIESSRENFPGFEPDADYLRLLDSRIQRLSTAGVDRLLLLENGSRDVVALVWLELLTYPNGYDGAHDSGLWADLVGKLGVQIRNTWVHKHCRRRGLGTTLKLEAETVAANEDAEFSYTRCGKRNAPIIALNRRLGYEIIDQSGEFLRLRKLLALAPG